MLSPLSNLSLKVKLWGLVGLMVAIIVAFTATFTAQSNEAIAFSDKERVGNNAITYLRPLLSAVAVHRGTQAMVFAGQDEAQAKLLEAEAHVDETLATLNTQAASLFAQLGLSDSLAQLPGDWQSLLRHNGNVVERFDAHSDFINQVRDLIVSVADQSNLTLDPDLDSFYLMDFVVLRSPALNEFAGQSREIGAQAVNRGFVMSREADRLAELNVRFKDAVASAIGSIESSAGANPEIAAALANDLDLLKAESAAFQNAVNELVDKGELAMSGGEFFAQGSALINHSMATTEKVAGLLEGLLAARVDSLKAELLSVLCGVLIALALLYILI